MAPFSSGSLVHCVLKQPGAHVQERGPKVGRPISNPRFWRDRRRETERRTQTGKTRHRHFPFVVNIWGLINTSVMITDINLKGGLWPNRKYTGMETTKQLLNLIYSYGDISENSFFSQSYNRTLTLTSILSIKRQQVAVN